MDWDADTPIETYFRKVKLCAELAYDGDEEYTVKEIIQIMFLQMKRILPFKFANREWAKIKKKTDEKKMIERFEEHYIKAYEKLLDDEADNEEVNHPTPMPPQAHNAIPLDLLEKIYAQSE